MVQFGSFFGCDTKSSRSGGTSAGRVRKFSHDGFFQPFGDSRKVPAGIAGFLQMGKSGAARAEFNAASAYTQRRKQRKASVAKRLQETRLKCGLKQQDVAERTGINVVTLSGYEIGKNEPNMEALVSLADVYGVMLDYLMCRTDS